MTNKKTIRSNEEYIKHLTDRLKSITNFIVKLERQIKEKKWLNEPRYGEPQYYYPLSERDLILVKESLIARKQERERVLLQLGNAVFPFKETQKNTTNKGLLMYGNT